MDTRTAALPNTYPPSRRSLPAGQTTGYGPTPKHRERIPQPQTAGLDQSLVGLVNASRIAALVGAQGANAADRSMRPIDGPGSGYRQTRPTQDIVPPASFTF